MTSAATGVRPGGTVRRRALVIGVITITDPLGDIAVHVVEAEFVGAVAADWRRIGEFILAIDIGGDR